MQYRVKVQPLNKQKSGARAQAIFSKKEGAYRPGGPSPCIFSHGIIQNYNRNVDGKREHGITKREKTDQFHLSLPTAIETFLLLQ